MDPEGPLKRDHTFHSWHSRLGKESEPVMLGSVEVGGAREPAHRRVGQPKAECMGVKMPMSAPTLQGLSLASASFLLS